MGRPPWDRIQETDESLSGFLETPVFELGLKLMSSENGSPEEDLIGITIDNRYLLEAELGHGAMGQVYLASDLELFHRHVVIKILRKEALLHPYVARKFEQEGEALARVNHPGVVGVLKVGKFDDGRPYLAMEYVDGQTLRSQITSGGMNLKRVATILEQIGSALDAIHAEGIFHRDLKPENIMLQVLNDGRELVKIVDFGIAKVKESVIASSTIDKIPLGTLAYMSPEQLRAEDNDITAESDIFSMAVIAYEMITGQRPFNAASGPQLLEMHREGVRVKPINLRPDLSKRAQAIICRALLFKPTNRYGRASKFANELARDLRSGRQKDERKNPAGRRTVIIGFVTVLACVAVLMGVYLYLGGNTSDKSSNLSTNSSSGPSHSFSYWLTVQAMRDGKPYQDPFKSNGNQDVFDSGDKFQLNISSPDPGYLYLFNEGPPESSGSSFTVLYPTPATNNGSAALGANQTVQTDWITFRGPPGDENFWIVWSASPVSELESARNEAFKNPDAGLTGQSLVAVREYLTEKQSEIKVRTTRYKASQTAVVRGTGDILVTLAQFKHR